MIAIDCTFISHGECRKNRLFTSFSIFIAEILDAFVAIDKANEFCLVINDFQVSLVQKRFPQYQYIVIPCFPCRHISNTIGRGGGKLSVIVKKLGIYRKIVDREKFEMMWYPYALPRNTVRLHIPTIHTIHDLMEYHNRDNEGDKKHSTRFREMINSSTKLTAISGYIANDIKKSFDYDQEITVIPNSINVDISDVQEVNLKNDFILDINGFGDHKNTLTLIKAFHRISEDITWDLVCCGGWKKDDYFNMLNQYIIENHLERRIHLFYSIPFPQRNWLLSKAKLFVTPSLNEGFGRTPVEAAICNIPVISSTEASLKEATMGLVNYYENALDEVELSDSILRLYTNPPSLAHLDEISKKLSAQYSPLKLATDYWKIFEELRNQN